MVGGGWGGAKEGAAARAPALAQPTKSLMKKFVVRT